MRVPRALKRENTGYRSLSEQAARNAVRLGFEMLRLTARCCGCLVRRDCTDSCCLDVCFWPARLYASILEARNSP
jgi:hypothetical protein